MSIKERISRIFRLSNTSTTSSSSDNGRKSMSRAKTIGRIVSRPFSRSKPSNSSTPDGRRSGSANTARTSFTEDDYPAPENIQGIRWEDMTAAQRVQANLESFELRFGASYPLGRASFEGISPCTTRVPQPQTSGND